MRHVLQPRSTIRRLQILFLIAPGMVWGQASLPQTGNTPAESVLFDTPAAVETAALYTQTLQEAPADVTVISRQQIRTYGYRTLAEALANVRGFYITHDGALAFAGVRGFGLPGDYNTRILVMLNGHMLTDNVYGAMYLFGQDFGIDMDLVERIEIVRGPSSAIYGSNGVFATINIFTRAPADSPRASATVELASFREKKLAITSSMYLGRGANLLLSVSGFHTRGRRIAAEDLGLTTGSVGAEQGYHTFAQLTWRDWSFTASFADRKVLVPIGWYATDFGDPGTSSSDAHNFVEASLVKPVGANAEIRWRIYYDQFRYYGRYHETEDDVVTDSRDYALGDWLGTRITYRRSFDRSGSLAVGAQADVDVRNLQAGHLLYPEFEPYLYANHRDRRAGVFAQYSVPIGRGWTLLGGARLDQCLDQAAFLSPRIALVWKRRDSTSYKFLYGRAFRHPSAFEQFWEPSPDLGEERMNTFEFSREQRVGKRLTVVTSAFHYRLGDLIEGVPVGDGTLEYRNVAAAKASGMEAEVQAQAADWLEVAAGLSLQRARYVRPVERRLSNSPDALVYLRGSAVLPGKRVIAGVAARSMSSRESQNGSRVGGVLLADLTATTNRLHPSWDVQFGIRNLTGRRYLDPMSAEHRIGGLPGAGRTLFVRLIWRYGD